MTKSYSDLLTNTIKQNEDFFQTTELRKKFINEIVELANDSIDMVPKSQDMSDPRLAFWLHALQPLSNGIFTSLMSGNLLSCFMQLRLLLEYLALNVMAEKIPGDNLLEKYVVTRNNYETSISKLLRDFDVDALELWQYLSQWLHARTYSEKIELTTINEGVKLWSIIQPAFYSKEDEVELNELYLAIVKFRNILKNHVFN